MCLTYISGYLRFGKAELLLYQQLSLGISLFSGPSCFKSLQASEGFKCLFCSSLVLKIATRSTWPLVSLEFLVLGHGAMKPPLPMGSPGDRIGCMHQYSTQDSKIKFYYVYFISNLHNTNTMPAITFSCRQLCPAVQRTFNPAHHFSP